MQINQIYPKRVFFNDQGPKEITTWDVFDSSGLICIVAFNNHSVAMRDQLQIGKVIEAKNFTGSLCEKLDVRTVWINNSIGFSIIQNRPA